MTVAQEIERILRDSLDIDHLQIVNESDHHIGHAGHDGGGESHFHLIIRSKSFMGLSRVAQHQKIYNLLSELLKHKIHALAIESSIPADLQPNGDFKK